MPWPLLPFASTSPPSQLHHQQPRSEDVTPSVQIQQGRDISKGSRVADNGKTIAARRSLVTDVKAWATISVHGRSLHDAFDGDGGRRSKSAVQYCLHLGSDTQAELNGVRPAAGDFNTAFELTAAVTGSSRLSRYSENTSYMGPRCLV